MKPLNAFVLTVFLSLLNFIYCQIPATTKDGKEIFIYPNHYWEYKESASELTFYFPQIHKNDLIVNHTYYSLSYDTIHRLAKWTLYKLSKSMLQNKVAERKNKFTPDPLIPEYTNLDADYKNSGFDKGHLVPAADMSFSEKAMTESFYFSNITPQTPSFNRGIWKKLEEQVRNWALQYENIVVISGAVISDTLPKLGVHQISIPYYFYKIIACFSTSCTEFNAIGFIIPNKKTELPLQHFVTNIDSIEHLTNLDFFSALDDKIEEKLEKNVSISFWFKEK